MKTLVLVGAFLLTVAISPALMASSWKLDKAHSMVNFSVAHLVISEVTGNFTDFDVTMSASKDDLTDASIETTIKSSTINTNNEQRDVHLKSDDFLNVEKFPEIRFKSTSVEKTGEDTYIMTGSLTIRDVTKTVVLDTKYRGTVKDPWGNTKVAFKTTTTINRFEYGLKWDAVLETGGFVAGEDVEITLIMEFAKE